jgi:hypothetical protein
MALIGIEGFEASRNSAQSPFDAGGVAGLTSATTPFGYGFAWKGSSAHTFDWNIGSNQDTIIQGMYSHQSNTISGFSILDGATIQVHLDCADPDDGSRKVRVYRGTGLTNLLGETAANALPPAGDYYHIGWMVKIHDTLGFIHVWIDGVLVLSLTDIDTKASGNAFATIVRLNLGQNNLVDDYFAFDGSGAENNDWPGTCRVYTGMPDSDDVSDLTPLSGTDNFAMVDEMQNHDTDTTYNHSSTAGDKDLFGTNLDLPVGSTVLACESRAVIRKDDVGARTGRAINKSGATQTNATTLTLGTTYALQRIKMDVDPDTGAAWTRAGANALEPGYEVMS